MTNDSPSDQYEQSDHSTVEQREQYHSGVSIKGETKMGSGTRDQSKIVLKGKGKNAEEAITEFEEALDAADNGDWGHRLLELNPEREDEADDE